MNIYIKANLQFPKYFSEDVKNLINKILIIDPKKRLTLE